MTIIAPSFALLPYKLCAVSDFKKSTDFNLLVFGQLTSVNIEEDRKNIVQSLRAVDEVIVFDSTNTIDLIKDLKPHLVVKGGERTAEEIRKRDEIPNDIEIYVYPFKEGYSSTNIINMIKEK